MNLYPKCIPCISQQAISLSEMAGITDPENQKEILYETLVNLLLHKEIKSPPHFSSILQNLIGNHTDIDKAIWEVKRKNLNMAKSYVRHLSGMVDRATDKLEMAVKASIAGNTIDLGANPNFDIEKEVQLITSNNIKLHDMESFRTDFHNADTILIIGDNYEEALFDKLLIPQLSSKNVTYAVRSATILNDITMEDAKYLQIDKLCNVMESGSMIAGTDMQTGSGEFKSLFNTADMVIAKGQGNYESLLNEKRSIYFMFKVKCDVIAGICGHTIGTSMLYHHQGMA